MPNKSDRINVGHIVIDIFDQAIQSDTKFIYDLEMVVVNYSTCINGSSNSKRIFYINLQSKMAE